MKIHEFQAKEILRRAGVAVPRGIVARTHEEAAAAFDSLGGSLAVVKSQIHAGGRGKGTITTNPQQHGVQLVKSRDEAAKVAGNLLGQTLVTIQTGPAGQTVRQVLVEEGCQIARELYLGIVVDRAAARPVLMVSSQGGMDIEQVAHDTPELIFREPFDPDAGLESYQVRKICWRLGLTGPSVRSAEAFMKALCRVFVSADCSLVEINPLVVTKAGDLIALDAKITFDDNALFRHKDFAELRDLSEEEPAEIRAGKAGLSYVKLDGNIGCLVNGAGLAMSTMDLILYHGGEPANFLDVGGGANVDQVTEAFRILLADKNTKAVLVNIFGGIMRCTTIASAILEAYRSVGFNVPLVVRLEGTEVEQGRKMLADSKLAIIGAEGLTDAAKKVVAAAGAA
jgi:succinyl-CoA synthetase beta subunit